VKLESPNVPVEEPEAPIQPEVKGKPDWLKGK